MFRLPNLLTPVVVLVLITMFFCVLFGLMTGEDPFGPGQGARATQAIINAQATEAVFHAMQTPQAIYVKQTVVVAELTAMPPALTATAVAVERNLAAEQQNAALTKIAGDTYLNGVMVAATATAVAENQRKQTATTNIGIGLIILGAIAFCAWMLVRVTVNTLEANTRLSIAQAKTLEQQHQLAEFRAAHQKTARPVVLPSVPISTVKERGNGHKLPHAE